ncbi:hypothetical protein AB0F96_38660 [Streptomyces sp. NPDC023998]|uniref:hypothetical protein n=1 Tax=Streptomyces sp. NPDC023998 TaxID=3154597 RepID=UPI0033DDEB84
MSAPRYDDNVSRTVSILTLSARIAESGSITHLPENVRPVSWAALYAGADETWERVAERRTNEAIDPLLKAIETAQPPAESAHLYLSVESWRRAAAAETRRTAKDKAYERVVGKMRRDALAAIDTKGPAFRPVQWEESARVFRVQGEWTVTVSVTGTDHTAVREAFAVGLPGRRDEILADAQKRIPRVSGTVKAPSDTPEKVRKAWRRDRRKGTAPKPATGAYSPGSWVTWQRPETGETCTGIVTRWLPGERTDTTRRTVIPSDGSEPVAIELATGAKPTVGPWRAVYGEGLSSSVEPGVLRGELVG